MNNTQAYPVAKSDKIYISVEYLPDTDSTATEFQTRNKIVLKQLVLAEQKAVLTMNYLSPSELLFTTFKAITQHMRNRIEMVFGI